VIRPYTVAVGFLSYMHAPTDAIALAAAAAAAAAVVVVVAVAEPVASRVGGAVVVALIAVAQVAAAETVHQGTVAHWAERMSMKGTSGVVAAAVDWSASLAPEEAAQVKEAVAALWTATGYSPMSAVAAAVAGPAMAELCQYPW
jgi:hypothetical protein